jgi:23S rRNA pseudouridine1911/1915/1917 synthase
MTAGLQILYEDNHLLAVNKPPGLPTMGVAAGEISLVVRAKQYIKHRYH